MPRPRTVADDVVLDATGDLILRIGPRQVTLARVAAEVGLSAATLLQRFGSKRALLLALARRGEGGWEQTFAEASAVQRSPLDALLAALEALTRPVATPDAMANSVAFLQIDLSDEDFHRAAVTAMSNMRDHLDALLQRAVEAGELQPCDTARLARAVQTTYNGSLVTWAIYREGSIAAWLRSEVELVLAPYRIQEQTAQRRGGSAARP